MYDENPKCPNWICSWVPCIHKLLSLNNKNKKKDPDDSIIHLLEGAVKWISYELCQTKGQLHCSHMKPPALVQNLMEMLHIGTISSKHCKFSYFCLFYYIWFLTSLLDLHNCLCSLSIAWTQAQALKLQHYLAISSYQVQLSEFTLDLLIAEKYHSYNPN